MKKIKYGCDTSYATCIIVESTPNPQSSLLDVECISQQDFNEDVYEQLENIQTQSDLSELGEQCLDYVLVSGKLFVKNALLKMEEEVCSLKNKTEALENRQLCDIPITECFTNFDCLVGECDTSIVTLKDWMLAVQTKICTP